MDPNKIDDQLVGDEIYRLEKELQREIEAGTLTTPRLKLAVDACLGRMGIVAHSRLLAKLRERQLPETIPIVPVLDIVVPMGGVS